MTESGITYPDDRFESPYIDAALDGVERSVVHDTDSDRRTVVVTNGEWLEVGISPADGRCIGLPLSSTENYWDKIRSNGARVLEVDGPVPHGSDTYTVSRPKRTYRIFDEGELVLTSTDHEFSNLRAAYKFAQQVRQEEVLGIERKARCVLEAHLSERATWADLDVHSSDHARCQVTVEPLHPGHIPMTFINTRMDDWTHGELINGRYDDETGDFVFTVSFEPVADYEALEQVPSIDDE